MDNGHDGTLRGGNGNDHIRAVAVYSGSQSDVQGGAGDDNIEAHNGVGSSTAEMAQTPLLSMLVWTQSPTASKAPNLGELPIRSP